MSFPSSEILLAWNDPVEYEYEYEEDGGEISTSIPTNTRGRCSPATGERMVVGIDAGMGSTMNNVIEMPGSANGVYEVMVMEPRSLKPQAIQALQEAQVGGAKPDDDGSDTGSG